MEKLEEEKREKIKKSQDLDRIDRVNFLYDIYGKLLTSRQREVLEYYYINDYSLGEIAEQYQISRQGVHAQIKKAEEALEKLENTLGLYQGYFYRKKKLQEAIEMLSLTQTVHQETLQRLRTLLKELYQENERG